MKELYRIYLTYFKKLLIAFALYSICRILFYLFNASYFSEITVINFLGGIRFDWVVISYLYGPFSLLFIFSGGKKWKITSFFFHLASLIGIVFNAIDFEYFKFTFKRTTADLFHTAGLENDILNLLPTFILDYWYVLIIAILLVFLSIFLYKKSDDREEIALRFIPRLALIIPILFINVIGARGGVQLKPLNVIQAGQYATAQNIPIALNTPFTIMKSFSESNLEPLDYYQETELNSIYNPIQRFQSKDSTTGIDNVVIIILESFAHEFIGSLSGDKSFTPYLDEIADNALVFENAFANGKKSIEALPAILAGIPTLMNTSYISSKYASNNINAIGTFLDNNHFETTFYHGGENGTMGFNSFAQIAGIKEYIGKNEYPYQGDYDGNWGIFDEPFLQFCLEDLNRKNEPFFASIFTLSSHHPFTIPNEHQDKFNKSENPFLNSILYADYALKSFFEKTQNEEWFDRTLFVITADHTSQSFTTKYNNRLGMYKIPLIFYAPNAIIPYRDQRVCQQSDIYPTIIDFLGIQGTSIGFGQSLMDKDSPSFAINFINDSYQYIEGNYCIHFDGEKTYALYDRIQDPALLNNLIEQKKEEATKLELKLKAILQQYNNRLINNNLTP